MNKHLLLALLLVPLIAGCEANASSGGEGNATLKWIQLTVDDCQAHDEYGYLYLERSIQPGAMGVLTGVEYKTDAERCNRPEVRCEINEGVEECRALTMECSASGETCESEDWSGVGRLLVAY
jgi:hypothetical protein